MALENITGKTYFQGEKGYKAYVAILFLIGLLVASATKPIFYLLEELNPSPFPPHIAEQVLSNLAAGLILASILSVLALKYLFPDVKNVDIQEQIESVKDQLEDIRREILNSKGEGLGTVLSPVVTLEKFKALIGAAKKNIYIISYGVAILDDEHSNQTALSLRHELADAIIKNNVRIRWFQVGDLISLRWYQNLKELKNGHGDNFEVYYNRELSMQFPNSIMLIDPEEEGNSVMKIFYEKNEDKIPFYEISYGVLFSRNLNLSQKILKSLRRIHFDQSNRLGEDKLGLKINEIRSEGRQKVKEYLYQTYKTLEINNPERKKKYQLDKVTIEQIACHFRLLDLDIVYDAFIDKFKELAGKGDGEIYFAHSHEVHLSLFQKEFPSAVKLCEAYTNSFEIELAKFQKKNSKITHPIISLVPIVKEVQKNIKTYGILYYISKEDADKIKESCFHKEYNFSTEDMHVYGELFDGKSSGEVNAFFIFPKRELLENIFSKPDFNENFYKYKKRIIEGHRLDETKFPDDFTNYIESILKPERDLQK